MIILMITINLLGKQQYGFRRRHSTEYAAVNLIDHFCFVFISVISSWRAIHYFFSVR